MAAERPESSTPCRGGLDQGHEGSSSQPHTTRAGESAGTCKYVLKMCLAERVMSSPMPIFYRGSKGEVLVGTRPAAGPPPRLSPP